MTMTDSNKEYEYWGKVATEYDAATEYVIGQDAQRETGKWLSGQFKATDDVLEMGCGTGSFSIIIAERVRHLTATDRSPEMLKLAQVRLRTVNNVTVLEADCYQSSFPDGTFDGVFLGNLLHILRHPMDAVIECHRILKADGCIVVADATSSGMNIFSRLAMGVRYLKKFGLPPKENRIVSPDDITGLVETRRVPDRGGETHRKGGKHCLYKREETEMKELPMMTMNYRKLYQIFAGSLKARLMMTGIELKVFNLLGNFCSAEDAARDMDTHPENTRHFLDALATIDLVEKKNGLYRNLPIAQTFLSEDSPGYIGAMLRMNEQYVAPLQNMTRLVKEGPGGESADRGFASQELWAKVTRSSAAWVTSGMGLKVAGIISKLPGFPEFQRMLDLGGGHGMFALYIVNAHPFMKGIVFDRPAVVEIAREFICEYGMEDRLDVAPGDYMADDIGTDYDLIWASATLNFAKGNMDFLIEKLYRAIKPGGYFISFQDGMTHERTKPDTMLGHLADQFTTGVDFLLDQGLVADSMIRCGFKSVRSRTIDTPMGEMDLDIARK